MATTDPRTELPCILLVLSHPLWPSLLLPHVHTYTLFASHSLSLSIFCSFSPMREFHRLTHARSFCLSSTQSSIHNYFPHLSHMNFSFSLPLCYFALPPSSRLLIRIAYLNFCSECTIRNEFYRAISRITDLLVPPLTVIAEII